MSILTSRGRRHAGDLTVFEKQAPFEVAELGSFSGLAEEYGLGEAVAAYPEDWRESLKLYRYCVLARLPMRTSEGTSRRLVGSDR